ncbi:unnamed protein product, partial [Phaeothamnion confervicola]
FLVEVRDAYGNVRRAGGDAVAATARLRGGDAAEIISGAVADFGNGTYEVTYTPLLSGRYSLSVFLPVSDEVAGSPFRLLATPGPSDAAGTSAGGGGLAKAMAGGLFNESVFEVFVGDAHSNRRADGGDAAALAVSFSWDGDGVVNDGAIGGGGGADGSADGNGFSTGVGNAGRSLAAADAVAAAAAAKASGVAGRAAVAAASVTDLGSGRYSIAYNLTLAGDWRMAVTMAGSHIVGSPFALQIVPGPTFPAACTCEGCGALASSGGVASTPSAAGVASALILVARDRYGNAVPGGREAWSVALEGDVSMQTNGGRSG